MVEKTAASIESADEVEHDASKSPNPSSKWPLSVSKLFLLVKL